MKEPSAIPDCLRALLERRVDRFWRNVDKSNHDGCWLWTASLNSGRYGQVGRTIDGKCVMILAHRMAYFLAVGAIPANCDVRHTCKQRLCCNPDHLFLKERGSGRIIIPEKSL